MYRSLLLFVFAVAVALLASVVPARAELKVGGYAQVQAVYDNALVDRESYFTVKRVRVSARGTFDKIGLYAQWETFTAGNNTVDLLIDYDLAAAGKAGFGRFLVPLGIQGPGSSYNLLTINYAQVVSNLALDREFGARLVGSYNMVNWNVSLVNGNDGGTTPVNTTDDNSAKDIVARVGVAPFKNLEAGLSIYNGQETLLKVAKDRTGLDIKYDNNIWLAQFEYFAGKDAAIEKAGFYFEGGYKINKFQPVVRVESYDGNTSIEDASEISIIAVGCNYYVNDTSKLQFIYESKSDKMGARLSDAKNDDAILQFALKF